MLLTTMQPLFPWDALDDSPTLATIKLVLATIPDQPLLDSLRRHRGHGRDDGAIHVLWGVILLTILLRHPRFAACLAELTRNDDLRVLIGLPREDESAVPEAWNVSRFLDVLGQPPPLGALVPDLGVPTAGDAAALNAWRTRSTPAAVAPTAAAADPGSGVTTPPPQYDLAADAGEVHEFLHERGIEPVIQNRTLWKQDPERLLPGHDGTSTIVYDEAGTVYCYDKVSEPPVRHRRASIGHEPERRTLKYRCPAQHEDWTCPRAEICNAGKSYGKTVRIKQEKDLRRFPPIPRATKQFERLDKGRTAVERVNGRVKIYWGADDGHLVGATRFHALLGTVLVVPAALATVLASLPRRDDTLGTMKLSPIAAALQAQRAAQPVAVPA